MNKKGKNHALGKSLIIIASLVLCLGIGAVQAIAAIDTTNNNFTMIDPGGGITGAPTTSIHWDATTMTSVAASGQSLMRQSPPQRVLWRSMDST